MRKRSSTNAVSDVSTVLQDNGHSATRRGSEVRSSQAYTCGSYVAEKNSPATESPWRPPRAVQYRAKATGCVHTGSCFEHALPNERFGQRGKVLTRVADGAELVRRRKGVADVV
jgi:hypothetical protein